MHAPRAPAVLLHRRRRHPQLRAVVRRHRHQRRAASSASAHPHCTAAVAIVINAAAAVAANKRAFAPPPSGGGGGAAHAAAAALHCAAAAAPIITALPQLLPACHDAAANLRALIMNTITPTGTHRLLLHKRGGGGAKAAAVLSAARSRSTHHLDARPRGHLKLTRQSISKKGKRTKLWLGQQVKNELSSVQTPTLSGSPFGLPFERSALHIWPAASFASICHPECV